MAGRTHLRQRLIYLLLMLWFTTVGNAAPSPEPWELDQGNNAEAFASVLRQIREDPEVMEDHFEHLGQQALRQLGQYSPKWRPVLEDTHLSLSVEVILIGFAGGGGGVRLDEHEIARYLDALDMQMEWRMPRDEGNPLSEATLPVRFFFRVRHSSLQLNDNAARRVFQALSSAPQELETVTIPHSTLDDLLREDAETAELSYSLYLLNFPQPARPYLYTYRAGGCAGSLWAGEDRYAWVDLSAGPISYGSLSSAPGYVTPHSLPNVTAWAKVADKRGLSVEVAASVHSMCKHLLVRSPARVPHWLNRRGVNVVLVRMTDSAENVATNRIKLGADAATLSQQLLGMQLGEYPIKVDEVELPMGECSSCVAAYTRALRSSLLIGEDGQPQARQYLDAAELAHWLSPLLGREEKASYSDREREVLEKLSSRPGRGDIVPVFILDLNLPHPLLLDGQHQALAMEGGVVAVHTRYSLHQPPGQQGVGTGMQCNGARVRINPDILTRPILSALLQVVWGVQKTDVEVDGETESERRSYLWSVGHDIFSPLSQVEGLSFADRDIALRNVLIPRLLGVRKYLLDLFHGLGKLQRGGGALLEAIPRDRRTQFVQRTNYLISRYTMALRMLSMGHYNATHYLTMSMMVHDTAGLMQEVSRAEQQVRSSLHCFEEAGGGWWGRAAVAVAALTLVAACGAAALRSHRRKTTKPKLY